MVTLDDIYTFKDFGLIPLQGYKHPIISEISNKTIKIPGVPGEYYFGTEIGTKSFSIPLGIIERDKNIVQQKLNKLVSFLFDQYGKPRLIKMVFDYEPDVYYMVRVNSNVTPDRMMIATKFSLPFVAYDPYKYSVALADEITWGSETITFEYDYLMGHEGTTGLAHLTKPQTLLATVDGLAVRPVIEIFGSASGLSLFTGNYTIKFPNFSNTTWVIDCDKYTVLKNGSNAFNEVSLRDFVLTPGTNFIDMIASTISITIQIKFRDKYI